MTKEQSQVHKWTADETVAKIQHASKNIKEYSYLMRNTVKTVRESGAIPELVDAIREASFALRDTVNEINQTTKEIHKKGTVTDNAIDSTIISVEDSVNTVKEIVVDAGKVLPHSKKAVHDGIQKARHLKLKVGVA
jgi:methyl-accepting chemotaxis protein